MGRWEDLYESVKNNPKDVRFSDLCKVVEQFGFAVKGRKGSHIVYAKKGVFEILNFQEVGGKGKPYQVRQFLKIVEKYQLKIGGGHV